MRTLADIMANLPPDRRAKVMANGQLLIQAANEALAYAKGEADVSQYVVHPAPEPTLPSRRPRRP